MQFRSFVAVKVFSLIELAFGVRATLEGMPLLSLRRTVASNASYHK